MSTLKTKVDAAVKAERDRIYDLFLTQPITLTTYSMLESEEVEAAIIFDRFNLMTAVRDVKIGGAV